MPHFNIFATSFLLRVVVFTFECSASFSPSLSHFCAWSCFTCLHWLHSLHFFHCIHGFTLQGSFRMVPLFVLTGFHLHFAWSRFLFSLVCIYVLTGFARVHLACANSVVVSIEFYHLIRELFSAVVNAWFHIPCRFTLVEVSSFVKFIKNRNLFSQIFYQQLNLVYIWW